MKRIIVIVISLLMIWSSMAFGETRAVGDITKLTFSDNEAHCYVKLMYANKAIDATVSLYKGSTEVKSWHKTGTDRLIISGSYPAEGGKTYTMKIKGNVGGKDITIPNVKKYCPKSVNADPPKKASIKSVTSTTEKFTVSWKKVSGAIKYQVAYKKSGASKWTKKTVSGLKLTVKGTPLTKYSVKVRAKSYTKYSKWSDVSNVTTSLAKPVAKVCQKGSMVELSWGKVAKAAKYKFAYKKKSDTSWSDLTTKDLSFNIKCEPRKTYQFKVQAIGPKSSQKSLWSKVKTLYVESEGDLINELTPQVAYDVFDLAQAEGTNQYQPKYFAPNRLPVTELPEYKDTLEIYKITHKNADLSKLKAFVRENQAALTEISGIDDPELEYEKKLDKFDNYGYYGNHFEKEEIGDNFYYRNIGAWARMNLYDVFASADRIKYQGEYLSILESDSDADIRDKIGPAIDYYMDLFGQEFSDSKILRSYDYDGLKHVGVFLYNSEASEMPDYMTLPSFRTNDPLCSQYIVLCFETDWGEGSAYDWGGSKEEAFLTRVDYVKADLPYDQYLEDLENVRMLTLEEAEEMLTKGYVFGGHYCSLCMADQPEVDFTDYDVVKFEYVAGRNRIVVPFYTFYKYIKDENGLCKYAKTYVCAVDLPGLEEFFKEQEKYHKG